MLRLTVTGIAAMTNEHGEAGVLRSKRLTPRGKILLFSHSAMSMKCLPDLEPDLSGLG